MNRIAISGLVAACLTTIVVSAQQKAAKPAGESNETKIARALSAGPANIAKRAKVVDRDENGKETVLREGTNGFTCFPGHHGIIGDNTFCANEAALQWEKDFAANKPKPTNAEPGIEYMLLGGTDWSASDPRIGTFHCSGSDHGRACRGRSRWRGGWSNWRADWYGHP